MMLAHEGIISLEDSLSIITGLTQIQKDIESGALAIDETAEDIHMFMESELTKRIQDAGKRLHTARSRNDQVALDTRMYALDETDKILTEIKQFINVLLDKAQENLDTIMPGYTHLQRAQPITFAHHLMAYVEMLKRDRCV